MDRPAADNGSAPYLVTTSLTKYFGSFPALSDITFSIARGEFICFLGPSGCGKTTLLRCIAGLETQTEGEIRVDGRDVSWLPPSRRDFGIVFQSYALFPNLTVAANVGFGLVNQRVGRDAVERRVDELLSLVDLSGHAAKYPAQLSGGEQQRVALARALAPSPGLLLLDEPLSALDAKVRARLRREIRDIQDRLGVTTIMVTHDQEEAQTMADRIFVLDAGRIEQMGTPSEIYDAPATPFVADFIGVMNFLPVTVVDQGHVRSGDHRFECATAPHATGAALRCAVRPEDISLEHAGNGRAERVEAEVRYIEMLGSFMRVYLFCEGLGGLEIRADVRKDLARAWQLAPRRRVSFSIPSESIRLYGPEEPA